jgi:hypothetical protein
MKNQMVRPLLKESIRGRGGCKTKKKIIPRKKLGKKILEDKPIKFTKKKYSSHQVRKKKSSIGDTKKIYCLLEIPPPHPPSLF